MDDDPQPPGGPVLGLGEAPGLIRMGVRAGLRTAAWTAGTALGASRQIGGALLPGEIETLRQGRDRAVAAARTLLGVTELDTPVDDEERNSSGETGEHEALRARGAELFARAADLSAEEEAHPAYARILTQLAPDEARILRMLAREGAQPAVDVRAWRPANLGSRLVEPGLTMIGLQAGCRHPERVRAYFNNLFRLGLIWFSHEPVEDMSAYEVLEAQPDVNEAGRRAGRSRTVRRSIRLTPFGKDFCEVCLPLDEAGETATVAGLQSDEADAQLDREGDAWPEGEASVQMRALTFGDSAAPDSGGDAGSDR